VGQFLILVSPAGGAPPIAAAFIIVGATLMAVGFVMAYFAKDNDIEVFVAHTTFGRAFDSGSDNPSWIPNGKTLKDFAGPGGLDLQLGAYYNLLCGFSLETSTPGDAVIVRPISVTPTTIVAVKFVVSYLTDKQRPIYIANFATKTIRHGSTKTVSAKY